MTFVGTENGKKVLTMAEYIEREAAIAKCREIVACEWNHRASPVSWADAYEQFAEDIEETPTADVAPVRHGRWLPFHSTAAGDIQYCSACEIGCTWKPNYCPNCGAKMDLEG